MKVAKKQTVNYKLLLLVIIPLVTLVAIGLGAYWYLSQQQAAKQQAEYNASLQKIDKQITELKKKRAEQLAAEKKAAEEKARAEQEAAKQAELAKNLAAQQAGKVVTPSGCAMSGAHSDPSSISVLVNKKRCFSPIDFVPADLTTTNGATISAKAAPSFTTMLQAAASAGTPLSVTSSYRSYASQVATYNHWVHVNGSTAAADTVSARPGYSEHQTGFTVDLSAGGCSLECFTGTAQYAWMQAHAAEHGFIERYPAGMAAITGYSHESWHYRYIGEAAAKDMKAKGVKTLEQYWGIPGGNY